MESDNKAAQKAQAERLRMLIAELTEGEKASDAESPEAGSGSDENDENSRISPRAFVEKRMRELDKERSR